MTWLQWWIIITDAQMLQRRRALRQKESVCADWLPWFRTPWVVGSKGSLGVGGRPSRCTRIVTDHCPDLEAREPSPSLRRLFTLPGPDPCWSHRDKIGWFIRKGCQYCVQCPVVDQQSSSHTGAWHARKVKIAAISEYLITASTKGIFPIVLMKITRKADLLSKITKHIFEF